MAQREEYESEYGYSFDRDQSSRQWRQQQQQGVATTMTAMSINAPSLSYSSNNIVLSAGGGEASQSSASMIGSATATGSATGTASASASASNSASNSVLSQQLGQSQNHGQAHVHGQFQSQMQHEDNENIDAQTAQLMQLNLQQHSQIHLQQQQLQQQQQQVSLPLSLSFQRQYQLLQHPVRSSPIAIVRQGGSNTNSPGVRGNAPDTTSRSSSTSSSSANLSDGEGQGNGNGHAQREDMVARDALAIANANANARHSGSSAVSNTSQSQSQSLPSRLLRAPRLGSIPGRMLEDDEDDDLFLDRYTNMLPPPMSLHAEPDAMGIRRVSSQSDGLPSSSVPALSEVFSTSAMGAPAGINVNMNMNNSASFNSGLPPININASLSYGSLRDSHLKGRFLDGPASYRDKRTGIIRRMEQAQSYTNRVGSLNVRRFLPPNSSPPTDASSPAAAAATRPSSTTEEQLQIQPAGMILPLESQPLSIGERIMKSRLIQQQQQQQDSMSPEAKPQQDMEISNLHNDSTKNNNNSHQQHKEPQSSLAVMLEQQQLQEVEESTLEATATATSISLTRQQWEQQAAQDEEQLRYERNPEAAPFYDDAVTGRPPVDMLSTSLTGLEVLQAGFLRTAPAYRFQDGMAYDTVATPNHSFMVPPPSLVVNQNGEYITTFTRHKQQQDQQHQQPQLFPTTTYGAGQPPSHMLQQSSGDGILVDSNGQASFLSRSWSDPTPNIRRLRVGGRVTFAPSPLQQSNTGGSGTMQPSSSLLPQQQQPSPLLSFAPAAISAPTMTAQSLYDGHMEHEPQPELSYPSTTPHTTGEQQVPIPDCTQTQTPTPAQSSSSSSSSPPHPDLAQAEIPPPKALAANIVYQLAFEQAPPPLQLYMDQHEQPELTQQGPEQRQGYFNLSWFNVLSSLGRGGSSHSFNADTEGTFEMDME